MLIARRIWSQGRLGEGSCRQGRRWDERGKCHQHRRRIGLRKRGFKLVRPLMYRIKSSGPRMEPCGMPEKAGRGEEVDPLTTTL